MWVQSSLGQQHWGEAPHSGTHTHTHSLLRPWLTSSHWGGLDARSPWVDHGECGPRECVKAPSPRRDTCLLEAPAPATVQPRAARRAPRALPAAGRACLLPARPPTPPLIPALPSHPRTEAKNFRHCRHCCKHRHSRASKVGRVELGPDKVTKIHVVVQSVVCLTVPMP